jgi:hypothetical protein
MREAALVGGFFRLKIELVMSLLGTFRTSRDVCNSVANGGKADMAQNAYFGRE